MAAPAAAPAAPALSLTAALWYLVFALAVVIGLQYTYDYTFGAFLRRLARMVEDIWVVGGTLADAFDAADHWVLQQLGRARNGLELAVGQTWSALAYIVRETGDAILAFGEDVYAAIAGLVDAEIPQQVESKTRPLTDRLSRTNRAQDARIRAEALARSRGIDELTRDLTREQLARERGIDRIATRLGELVMPRIRALDQAVADVWGYTRRNLNIRLRYLEQLLAAGAVGAVALAAVTRVFPYWQCSNVRSFNRALCRSPFGSLGAWTTLLNLGGLFALEVIAARELCAFVNGLSAVARSIQPELLAFVDIEDALIAEGCGSKPQALPIGALGIPRAPTTYSFAL